MTELTQRKRCTHIAESFISARAGTQNKAPPMPNNAKEMPFNHSELKSGMNFRKSSLGIGEILKMAQKRFKAKWSLVGVNSRPVVTCKWVV